MKSSTIFIVIFVVLVCVVGGLIFLLFSDTGLKEQQGTTTRITTTETTSTGENQDGDPDSTSECPTGYVCLGGVDVASAPTITMGENAVFSQESGDDTDGGDTTTATTSISDQGITEKTPINVIVTNKDYKIWTVAWVTHTAQTGYIQYGLISDGITRQVADDRDSGISSMQKRFTHHVTITNSDTDLEQSDLTLYFKIMSGAEEFFDNGQPFEYSNAPLTASPSSPNSIAVTSQSISGYDDTDYLVVARMIDSNGVFSSPVSAVFNDLGGVEVPLGIARKSNLSTYFGVSSSNDVEVKLFGPGGYTGYVERVELGSLEGGVLTITTAETGYGDSGVFVASAGSNYTISNGGTDGTSTIPATGIGNAVMFRALWGLIIFLLGITTMLLFVPWNYKRLWEKRALEGLDRDY